MKTSNPFRHLFLLVTLIAVCFSTSAYSDSFVDDSVMNSLKDFKFGQTVSSDDKRDIAVDSSFEGDSFVSNATMETLKDFRFVFSDDTTDNTVAAITEEAYIGDSFVSAKTIKQLEGFVFCKSRRTIETSLTNSDTSY